MQGSRCCFNICREIPEKHFLKGWNITGKPYKGVHSRKAHSRKQDVNYTQGFIAYNELSGKGIASWFNPKGGYFISLDVMEGCAKRVGDSRKQDVNYTQGFIA